MKRILLAGLCLILTSCAYVPRHEYSGSKKPKTEISIVKGFYPGFMKEGFSSAISGYSKIENEAPTAFKSLGNSMVGFPNEIHLLPGNYIIQMYCFTVDAYTTPNIAIETKAGYTYVITCEVIPHEPAEEKIVRAIVHSIKESL